MNMTIIEQLTAAIAAKKDSLKALRNRIAELLLPIPVGVTLADENGEVCRISRVCCGASQWSNHSWDVTIKGTAALVGGRLLCEIDVNGSHFDGNNLHHRKTGLYAGAAYEPDYDSGDTALVYLNGAATRALALRLPAAIERYMAHCAQEAALNAATLTEVE